MSVSQTKFDKSWSFQNFRPGILPLWVPKSLIFFRYPPFSITVWETQLFSWFTQLSARQSWIHDSHSKKGSNLGQTINSEFRAKECSFRSRRASGLAGSFRSRRASGLANGRFFGELKGFGWADGFFNEEPDKSRSAWKEPWANIERDLP